MAQLTGLDFTPGGTAAAGTSSAFTYGVADPSGASVTGKAILAVTAPVPPVIAGAAAGQAVSDEATLSPFSAVTVTDANAGQARR